MSIKKVNGLTGIDLIIAVMAILIFSTLIISLMCTNILENVKLKQENLAMIYLTEIFENIAMEDYNNVTDEKIDNLIPLKAKELFDIETIITTEFEGVPKNQEIMKKVKVIITYEVVEKKYTCSMERIKV